MIQPAFHAVRRNPRSSAARSYARSWPATTRANQGFPPARGIVSCAAATWTGGRSRNGALDLWNTKRRPRCALCAVRSNAFFARCSPRIRPGAEPPGRRVAVPVGHCPGPAGGADDVRRRPGCGRQQRLYRRRPAEPLYEHVALPARDGRIDGRHAFPIRSGSSSATGRRPITSASRARIRCRRSPFRKAPTRPATPPRPPPVPVTGYPSEFGCVHRHPRPGLARQRHQDEVRRRTATPLARARPNPRRRPRARNPMRFHLRRARSPRNPIGAVSGAIQANSTPTARSGRSSSSTRRARTSASASTDRRVRRYSTRRRATRRPLRITPLRSSAARRSPATCSMPNLLGHRRRDLAVLAGGWRQ